MSLLDPDYLSYSSRLIKFLCFSPRPILICEAGDALAVDLASFSFDSDARFLVAQDISTLCPHLVTTSEMPTNSEDEDDRSYSCWRRNYKYPVFDNPQALAMSMSITSDNNPLQCLKLVHHSVKEFLVSHPNTENLPVELCLREDEAYAQLANVCLAYLLQFQDPATVKEGVMERYPFAWYAATNWCEFARLANPSLFHAEKAIELLTSKAGPFLAWLRLDDPLKPWNYPKYYRSLDDCYPPLYYAIHLGLPAVFEHVLGISQGSVNEVHFEESYLNRRLDLREKPSALLLAAERGYKPFLDALVSAGADVQKFGGDAVAVAIASNQWNSVYTLMRSGVSAKEALYYGILHTKAPIVKQILECNDIVNELICETSIPTKFVNTIGNVEEWTLDLSGCTPLHLVAIIGDIPVIEELLRVGADIRSTAHNGYLPFHMILRDRLISTDAIEALTLLAIEDLVVQETLDGRTCLHILAEEPVYFYNAHEECLTTPYSTFMSLVG